MRILRQVYIHLPVLFVLATLLLPAAGPLVDHHFAERQPGHLHIGMAGYRAHDHGYEHAHGHSQADGSGYPVVLYSYDGATVAIPAVARADTAMELFLDFEPGSIFTLPLPPEARVKHIYISPPGKPPQHLP
jgi:hypothetical protein